MGQQSGTKPKLVARILATNFGNHLCIGHQNWLPILVLSFTAWSNRARYWFSCQMATNKSSPPLQIRHNLSGLLLANWNWLHPVVIAFNTLSPVEFYIQWYGEHQCWKFPQVRRSEADNFGGGQGTFCWFFFNFMFMIWFKARGPTTFLTEFKTLGNITELTGTHTLKN